MVCCGAVVEEREAGEWRAGGRGWTLVHRLHTCCMYHTFMPVLAGVRVRAGAKSLYDTL